MGRRKIEIKAIKDDRNRSVTFLKRKGGLFKKAHELSVLCSVDVAVIIFGHNKKLYEFSSGDINETIGRYQYYGTAHEHKGPEDFMGKRDMDDDEDDDENMGTTPPEERTPPDHHMMPHHLQNQAAFQHMRHPSASASPPMPNGLPYHHRHASPQPSNLSRPNSRNQVRRPSSHLVPPHHQHSQAPPAQMGYAYQHNSQFYNPQSNQNMPAKAPPPPSQANQQYHYTHPPPQGQNPHVQQYMQDQRRQSMPPVFPQEHQRQSPPQIQSRQPPPPAQQQQSQQQQQQPQSQQTQQQQLPPPQPPHQQQQQQQSQSQSPPQHEQNPFHSPPLPQPKPLSKAVKKNSIFTPIEDNRSMLAQIWGNSSSMEPSRPEVKMDSKPEIKLDTTPRSHSVDTGMPKPQTNGVSPPRPTNQSSSNSLPNPQRTLSTPVVPTIVQPPRVNSLQSDAAKRPRLKVQIPSGSSDGGSPTAGSSPKPNSATGAAPAKANDASHSSGVVLPPPSPSASALLSAGATGPPNPFARPAPPHNSTFGSSRGEMETPISALPSRFVADGLLPSPSSFYPEWGFGRGDSNMLPSPLTFQTPVVTNGPSFRDDDDRKRKTSEGSPEAGAAKKVKA